MKRLFGALLVGTLVFGAVLASAAALNVDGGTLQVGTDTTLACDTNGVAVNWNFDYSGTVTSVGVSGIAPACAGQHLYVYALNIDGNIIGATGPTPPAACGAPGDPVAPTPWLIDASGSHTFSLGYVNPPDNGLGSGTYPCGVPGALIEGVRVMIGV